MKTPGIFVLAKREQRAVAVIMISLLVVAIAKHYQYVRLHGASPVTTETQPTASPFASPAEEERETPDESP
jgi:hypothetical protein